MAQPPTISVLPPAPSPSDTKAVFDAKAFPFVASLAPFVGELNLLSEWINEHVNLNQVFEITGTSADILAEYTGGYIRTTNAATKTLNLLSEEDAPQEAGAKFFIVNIGAGDLDVDPAPGVTINNNVSLSVNSSALLQKVAEDTYDFVAVGGDFTSTVTSVEGRIGDVILNYDTPAQAALASLPVGAKYSTKGADAVGDGGQGDFIVYATAPYAVNGYTCFAHANGTFGVLQGEYNVLQFGARGDCTGVGLGTNDSTAIQRSLTWWISADFQRLIFPAGHRFRMSSAVTANATGKKGMHLEMLSPVTPDAVAMDAITISGMRDSEASFYFEGGGTDANYMLANPAGGSQGVVIAGCRRFKADVKAHSYDGRALRTKGATLPYKTSFLDLSVDCGDITTSPGSTPTGQACFIEGTTAFGGFRYINAAWNKYSPVFSGVVDVVVNHAEFGASPAVVSSWTWDNCGSIWLGKMLLGDESGTQTGMSFINNCRRIDIDTFFSVNPLIAILAQDTDPTYPSLTIKNLVSLDAQQSALVLDNVKGANVKVDSASCVRAIEMIGGTNDVDIDITGYSNKKETIYMDSSIFDVRGKFLSVDASQLAAETYTCCKIDSTLQGIVLEANTRGSAPSASFDLAASNNVRILGGRLVTSPAFLSNEPRIVRNCEGAVSENKGTATILSGATTVVVNHGLYSTPDSIRCEGTTSDTASTWTTAEGTTQFTINVPSAVGGNRSVKWSASRKAF